LKGIAGAVNGLIFLYLKMQHILYNVYSQL